MKFLFFPAKMKLLIITAVIISSYFSCNTVEPPEDDTKAGRRDYAWTVDTLDTPNNVYYRIWGSSPSDVWIVSSSNWDKSIAHFNGEEWSFYQVAGLFNLNAIYGFSSNNIFVSADNGSIWRFDGTNWKLFAELSKDGHNDIVFDNIWGISSNNFYAFGAYHDNNGLPNNSVIANYKNNKWVMYNTDMLKGIVEHLYINKSDNKIYLQVINMGNGEYYDSTLIYEYMQTKFKQIYGSIWTQGLQADISLINGEVYFVLGSEIAIRRNDQFQTVLKINNPNFYQRIWGRNGKDIFLMMVDGLAHYNGIDIEYLFHYSFHTQIFGAALFDNEVIFLVYESSTHLNLIYHGKLNYQED